MDRQRSVMLVLAGCLAAIASRSADAGVCCLDDGTCQDLTEAACDTAGGMYQGDGLQCADTICQVQEFSFPPNLPGGMSLDFNQFDTMGDTRTLTSVILSIEGTLSADAAAENDGDVPATTFELRISGDMQATGTGLEVPDSPCVFQETIPCPNGVPVPPSDNDGVADGMGPDFCDFGHVVSDPCTGMTTTTSTPTLAAWTGTGMQPVTIISTGSFTIFSSTKVTFNLNNFTAGGRVSVAFVYRLQEGACCLADGTCTPGIDQAECESMGGTFQGDGTDCASAPCPQACCLPDGSCTFEIAVQCAAAGGVPQGDGVTCDTVECPEACCLPDGSCLELRAGQCTAMGGIAQGPGVACGDVQCPQACCLMDGTCDLLTSDDCINDGGAPQGPGVACDDIECPQACCLPDGTCELLLAADCSAAGGTAQGPGVMCVNMSCPEACCLEDGTCTLMEPGDCSAAGGTPQGDGVTCGDVECPQACCLADGTCELLDATTCTDQGGTSQGSGVACGDVECPQACCLSNGTCLLIDPTDCLAMGGSAQGEGVTCADVVCPVACCLEDGTCTLMEPGDCSAAGGTPQAPGVECGAVQCPQPCCLPDGTCALLDTQACTGQGGTPQGDGNTCADVACPQACCLLDGTCVMVDGSTCGQSGGIPLGPGVTCAMAPCPQACCMEDGSCLMLSPLDCQMAGGTTLPAGDSCDTARCEGACCLADGSCLDGRTLDECDAAGGLYQGLGDACMPDLCAPLIGPERAHPGWNWIDSAATWTANQPAYWSALTGRPGPGGSALPPFTVLDPSAIASQSGRPANDGTNDRVLRGYIVAFAVDDEDGEISWNHLKGDATIVNYQDGTAWEYNGWVFQDAQNLAAGTALTQDDTLTFDGNEYVPAFSHILLDFYAPGSDAMSNRGTIAGGGVTIETDLTLHPVSADLRQESPGPISTKASFVIWNEDETQFTNLHRCITCWDQQLLRLYTDGGVQNHFLSLQTDKGKARIDGIASTLCASNCCLDRGDATGCENFGCQEQVCATDPFCCIVRWDLQCAAQAVDLCPDECPSLHRDDPLLGVAAKHLTFGNGVTADTAAVNVIGMGLENAEIRYDPAGGGDSPPTFTRPASTDDQIPTTGRRVLGELQSLLDSAAPPVEAAVLPALGADRVSGTEKGSVVILSKVEIRWDQQGNVIQDTFIDLTNDYGDAVRLKLYFVNGDAPMEAQGP